MKRPLVPIALLYIGGILLASRVAPPLPELFVISFVFLIAALAWSRMRLYLIYPLLVLAGLINTLQQSTDLSSDSLRVAMGNADGPASLRGVLLETPRQKVHLEKGRAQEYSTAELAVTSFSTNNGPWQTVSATVMTSTKDRLPNTYYKGQTVQLSGTLAHPKKPVAQGLFDYPAYFQQLGIYYELRLLNAVYWKTISSPRQPPLSDRFCIWAKGVIARGLPAQDETLRLEWALTLGQRDAVQRDELDPFLHSGTYHTDQSYGWTTICGSV